MIYDLAIIGAGPAGAAAAITAARLGGSVLLLERGHYPRHKVCGEFVSPECLWLLASLVPERGLLERAPRIQHARVFCDDRVLETAIAPGAASITRHDLDAALFRAAELAGCDCRRRATVNAVRNDETQFLLASSAGEFRARSIINATGRWSNLTPQPAPETKWLGLKAHFCGEASSCDLYFFDGGYCGIQPIGDGRLNACAMVRAEAADTLDAVFARHPLLWRRSRDWQLAIEPVSTSPLVFREIVPVRDSMLQAGDAAGFIDPFLGDGISLALRSGTLAAECLASIWQTGVQISACCEAYATAYRAQFLRGFQLAAAARRVFTLPSVVRGPLLDLSALTGAAHWLFSSTRRARKG